MSASDTGAAGRDEPIDVEWEPAAADRRRSEGGQVRLPTAVALSVAAAVAGGAIGAVGSQSPLVQGLKPTGGETAAPTAALDPAIAQRLAAFESRWGQIELATAGGDPQDLTARIMAARREIALLEGRLGGADLPALAQEVAALKAQTDTIRTQSDLAARAARAAFAVAAATDAARGSDPFDSAYATLQSMLPGNPNVAALAPFAAEGAPSRAQLIDAFPQIEREALRAARISAAGSGLWAKLVAFLSQHVTIRDAKGAGGSAVDMVERASARLRDDDLAGAAAELARLPGPPAKVVEPWLQQARARLEIDARLAAIRQDLAKGIT